MKKIGYFFIGLLTLIFLSNNISAGGLQISSGNNQIFNKNTGISIPFQFTITNNESFPFYNVSFENSDIATMSMINTLNSGQSINVNGTLITNTNFNSNIRVKGLFNGSYGVGTPETTTLFLTYNTITSQYSLDSCNNLNIHINDEVVWTNNADSQVRILTFPDNIPVSGAEINIGDSFSKTFETPQVFRYYLAIASFPITPVCKVTVLSNEGLINDPDKDALLNLNVSIITSPTTIEINIPQTNYTITYGSSEGGVLTIKNNGVYTAKNVMLGARWFTFSENNLTIIPGQTKGISYTIFPNFIEGGTKNNTINLTISGNFNNSYHTFYINVPNMPTTSGVNSTDVADLEYLKNVYCPSYPHSFLCEQEPRRIIEYINNVTDSEFNVTMKNSQFLDLALKYVKMENSLTTAMNYIKENEMIRNSIQNETDSKIENMLSVFTKMDEDNKSKSSTNSLILVILISALVIGVSLVLIYYYKTKKMEIDLDSY